MFDCPLPAENENVSAFKRTFSAREGYSQNEPGSALPSGGFNTALTRRQDSSLRQVSNNPPSLRRQPNSDIFAA